MRRPGCSPIRFDPRNRMVRSVQKPWSDGCVYTDAGGQDPRGGSTGSPLVAFSDLPCRGRGPAGRQGGAGLTRLPPPLTAGPGAPLVAATGVALGAFRRRGFIDDDSDAIRARNPTRFRRLAGSRTCVGDHLRPVTGSTYDSRCRRLGSPRPPRGSGGDTGGARRNRQGLGTQRKDRCSGVRPLEVPVRSAVAPLP